MSNEIADNLKKIYANFEKEYEFKPGDIVKWKPGLKNKRRPRNDEPALVVEVFKEFKYNVKDDNPLYYLEIQDIRLGILDEEDELLLFVFDSRHFMPFKDS